MSDIRRAHEEEQAEAARLFAKERQAEATRHRMANCFADAMLRLEEDHRKAQAHIIRDSRWALMIILLLTAAWIAVLVWLSPPR